jgi:hypothetical protein
MYIDRRRHICYPYFSCRSEIPLWRKSIRGVCPLSLRVRFAITLILLLLTLFCVAFAARSTVVTWQQFRQQNAMARSGDVRTIGPWMTIPYIAHTYHIPETYLYSQLQLPDSLALHHTTLHLLAMRYHRPIDHLVSQLQGAITNYRKKHPLRPPPPSPGARQVPPGRGTP